jgi:photosystem II stability/assembly factor-like uncharacterized protein
VQAVGGDGYIQVTWDTVSGVDYFAFAANDPSITTLNWLNLSGAVALVNARAPLTFCGLRNGEEKWITVNGRSGSEPGGPGSPAVSATPRAAGMSWTAGTAMIDTLAGIGFSLFTTCQQAALPTGSFTGVGLNAAVYTSADGVNWNRVIVPLGFTADLFAVANYTANVNVTSGLNVRTIAVGAGGAALVSTDGGVTWTTGRSFDAGQPTLRGITTASDLFVAVGDSGAIQATRDGLTWSALPSNTSTTLNAVTYANGRYVAVGDAGTVLTSTDGGATWVGQSFPGAGNLRAITYGNYNNSTDNGGVWLINTFVAVGDNGTAVISNDGGASWYLTNVPGAGDLRGITYTTRFTAVDDRGNAFSSATGLTWLGPIETGQSGLNAIANNGYRLVSVGTGGANASSL